ncbi:Ig-like domain-containing protein [Paenibacillus chitinolyticus]|uniref:Ig-like domain-containing protein n=1 Tax=Paenibacillus chitinolyticus TaxID=79263 RepID=UPI00366B4393
MIRIFKQQKWINRPFAAILSLTLAASSFSMVGFTSKVEAAVDAVPGGGASKPVLWLKANDGATADGTNTITDWVDKTGSVIFNLQGTPPKLTANGVNFNPVVTISGNSGALEAGQKTKFVGDKQITYADAYAVFKNPDGVIVGSTSSSNNYGPGIFSKEGSTFYGTGNGTNSTYSTFNYPIPVAQPGLANFDIGGSEHEGRFNGQDQTLARKVAFGPLNITPVIGGTVSNNNGSNFKNFNGDIAEVIVYNSSTKTERAKIETYLAVKYGITLNTGKSNYIASSGDVVWTADGVYKNNIAGIANDSAEALLQKQSRSINTGDQVIIGIDTLSDTNAANTGTLADGQYLLWGDNGKTLLFNTPLGTTRKNYADRIWKVQNTNNVGEVQLTIAKSAIPSGATLVVSNSAADFTGAKEYPLTEILSNGVAYYTTTTKVALAHDPYFTFAAPAPVLDNAALEQVVGSGNKITLSFDQNLGDLPNLNGFEVKVDGNPVTINAGDYKVDSTDPTKLILILPNGTDVTGKTVNVSYDGLGTLKGANSVPAHSFNMNTIDSFTAALNITQPSINPVTVGKPTIEGTVEPGSAVNIVIKDSSGNPLTGAGGTATVDNNGSWTFIPNVNLTDGSYTIEATAANNNRTATKSVGINVALTAPVLTVTEPIGNTVSVSKPEFKGTTDAGAAVTVTIKDKGGNVVGTQAATVNPDGTWSFKPTADLADGSYTVEVTATKDGKTTKETKSVTVDTSLPALTVTEPSSNTVSVSQPEFKGTTDAGAAVTVTIKDKGGNVVGSQAATVNPDGTWSFKPTADLADGSYTVEVTATKDGKTAKETKTITVDTANHSSLTGLQLKSWDGTPIGLTPVSGGSLNQHTASVSNNVYTVTLLPTALDPNAKIEVSVNNAVYQEVPNGQASGNLLLKEGQNTIVVKVTDSKGNITLYTLTVTRESSSSGNSGGNNGGGTSGGTTTPTTPVTPKPEELGIETSINGKDGTFATGKTTTSGDRKQTSVQVDLDKLNGTLSEGNGQKLAIHSPNNGDVKVDGLTAASVKQLADKGASLEISNPLAIYPVPGGKMNLGGVSSQLGNAALGDIAVHIDIARSSDSLINNAKNKAAAEGYELLVSPVDLDLTFSHDGKTARSEQLNGYAAKYIALPEGIDPNRITTGVIVNPDGSVFHVPTVVTKINSRYYALINDLHSHGTYSVIWNPQDFDDVKKHWGKADVNNIAARLDLAGTGNNTFSPDRNVTRSEFSEIVVTGLGLMRQNAPQNKFPDVPGSAWYRNSVAIANEFDIVRGYDDDKFYGNQQITREQGIAMIARAYKLIVPQQTTLSQERIQSLLAQYGDAASVSAWAREDVARMIEAGIVQGNGPQLLSPQSNMTRAEVAALIARLLKTTNLIDK